jgi:hypothetical protein
VIDRKSPPSFSDRLIHGREALLNRLAGARPDLVFNPLNEDSTPPPADLAARIKETLDDLQASAMIQNGARVDYAVLRASPAYVSYQEECLVKLRNYQPGLLPGEEARRAFWINLYNALVLDAVIAFDVQNSVTEGRLGLVSFFRRAAYVVGGQRVSLEDMEHGILRANRGNPYVPGPHFAKNDPRRKWSLSLDPRIHFALNCGGNSCPPIRSYAPQRLNTQLDLAARSFINATVAVYPQKNEVHLSQILRWYQKDFGSREELVDFLFAHLPDDDRRDFLMERRGSYRLVYTPYDWGLNNL